MPYWKNGQEVIFKQKATAIPDTDGLDDLDGRIAWGQWYGSLTERDQRLIACQFMGVAAANALEL